MERTALFSKDKQYRYRLSRQWDLKKPMILFIMHNPSTADAFKEDRTLTRIINYAKEWGYGGLYVGNLFPYCSVKPQRNKTLPRAIIQRNKKHIKAMHQKVAITVLAWGNKQNIPKWIKKNIPNPYCITQNKKNIPKHPLYLKKNLKPTPFDS
ncbi:DUF1643 domain-containing protein [Flavobacteriaceae bacterium]|nr:DUF1643 domain-containing protein [Flavobacteriaceae bacterium]